ncbi:MAG: shikimate kinase [Sphaerochaetaceae bacterium]|jgi:shikimate kinase
MSIVYLLGIKHSGKSTLAPLVAKQLGMECFDTDDLIKELLPAPYTSIRQFYQDQGPHQFREKEVEALRRLLKTTQNTHMVVATGGGACDNQALVTIMRKTGTLVYLYVEKEILAKRIFAQPLPPFLQTADPVSSFNQLFEQRDRLYRKVSHIMVSLSECQQVHQCAQLVAAYVKTSIDSEEPCQKTVLEQL